MSTIPQPKTFGPLGNLPLIDAEHPVESVMKLLDEHGPLIRLGFPDREEIYTSDPNLVKELSDESKFDKNVWSPLQRVRPFAGDGLFTSWTDEPNWGKAHRLLMPSFSQRAMQDYHDKMVDIAVQLVQKWSRLNRDELVEVSDDMTRLTLDTIGLCAFNYRFNSFYSKEAHPFVESMVEALDEAMNQGHRLEIQNKLALHKKREFQKNIDYMFEVADGLIQQRKENGDHGENDLLSRMLSGIDPETGDKLPDENIRYQMITFLIAGHETTSGLLSFALYFLLNNPDKLEKARAEVDRVLADPVPGYKQVRDLKYIRMILREALRLWPTAPAFSRMAREDTMLAGKYPLQKGQSVNIISPSLHRNREVWGDNAEAFIPERFEDESQIPEHAYKPFGHGMRACIGQQFAMYEATLVLGMLVKHFEFEDAENYQLHIRETLTLKPDGFRMKVHPRTARVAVAIPGTEATEQQVEPEVSKAVQKHDTPLLALYGSNLGTSEAVARELEEGGKTYGFQTAAAPLDDYAGNLPQDGVLMIVASSYNGQPTGNAEKFVSWLQNADDHSCQGVKYVVFGCGDHNWASTYQRIPKLIDELLEQKGAERIFRRGEGDASGDFEMQLDEWRSELWPELFKIFNVDINEQELKKENAIQVQFVNSPVGSPLVRSYNALECEVLEAYELQQPDSGRSTLHLDIALPHGETYHEGDHMGIIPRNPQSLVQRVLRRFRMDGGERIRITGKGSSAAYLPLDRPVSIMELLTLSVELQDVATRAQIRAMADNNQCPPHRKELEALLDNETYHREILQKRVTLLDLMEDYMSCEMSFEQFLGLLPALKPRYYSISSSPAVQPGRASITVSVVAGPARSGKGEFYGIATSYLSAVKKGDTVLMFIRSPRSGFDLPQDPQTPIIMVGPGTGVAPFRGFLQARHHMKQQGTALGEARLYFGCRTPDKDYLYRNELERYADEGIVKLYTAFSRQEPDHKQYVQDMMREHAEELISLIGQGAKLYICGDGNKMAPDVEKALQEMYSEVHQVSAEQAEQWLGELQQNGHYVKDVWTGI
ncbi:bifunctional cytochrome P450/NADPH--P450 reductase [Paenibacillus wulumuqiensis]|uniref:bifunctional cytochrome P450/NADPH--P450 reductase n=1 Tax=Paenibacillus wulumuqiensis TaxID=1567107 RepID=UPI0009E62FC8|nr:cytochrome P450 [Paenibacillus wulumuqiensis]